MKNRIFSILAVLFAFMPQLLCAQEESATLTTGYCGETPLMGMSMGANQEAIVAVRFDEDFADRFAGCRVTAIRVCLSGVVGATAGVWLGEDPRPNNIPVQSDPNDIRTHDKYKAAQGKPEEFAYHFPIESWITIPKDQNAKEAMAWQWVEQKLPKKYTIKKGEAFYAGFRSWPPFGGASNAVVALSGGETDEHSWVYFNGSDDPWAQLLVTNMAEYGVNLMIQVCLEGSNLPTNDIAIAAVNGSSYLKAGHDYDYECVVQNMAANTIKSFDVTYYLDGQLLVQDKHMEFANGIKYKEYGGFVIKGINIDEPGIHHLEVTVSNPNGVTDVLDGDNTLTRSFSVYREEDVQPRRVLVEGFTGLTCGNCPGAHEREEEAFKDIDPIVVYHHSGFYEDPFTTDTDKSMTWFFNSTQTYAPAIMMDRTNPNDFYAAGTLCPVFLPGNPEDIRMIYDRLSEVPTYVNVDIDANYNAETRQLDITVSGDILAIPEASDPRLNVWLTENGIPSYKVKQAQTGSSEGMNYIHNHVMRATMTKNWGDPVDLKDASYSRTYTTMIPEDWVVENMEIVAFIGNINNYDVNDCQVLNAQKLVMSDVLSGIANVDAQRTFSTKSYNLLGQPVATPAHGVSIERTVSPNGDVIVRKNVK